MPIGYIAIGMIFGTFAAGYGLWMGVSVWLVLAIYSGVGTLAMLLPIWLIMAREVGDHSAKTHPVNPA